MNCIRRWFGTVTVGFRNVARIGAFEFAGLRLGIFHQCLNHFLNDNNGRSCGVVINRVKLGINRRPLFGGLGFILQSLAQSIGVPIFAHVHLLKVYCLRARDCHGQASQGRDQQGGTHLVLGRLRSMRERVCARDQEKSESKLVFFGLSCAFEEAGDQE